MPATASPPAQSIVVPTARLAAALQRQHARRQAAAGAQVWRALDVLGLGAWLTRASLAARCDGRLPDFALLGQEQAQALWTSIIATHAADESGRPLDLRPAQTEALARLMAEAEELVFAWELGQAWQAPLPSTFEQSLARVWHRRFRERCRELGVGTRTMLLEACAARGLTLAGPDTVSRGFEAAGPALRRRLPPGAEPADARSGTPTARPGTPTESAAAAPDVPQHARSGQFGTPTQRGTHPQSAQSGTPTESTESTESSGPELAGPQSGTPILRGTQSGTPTHRVYASLEEECDAALEWAQAVRAAHGDGGVGIVGVDARSIEVLLARARRWQLATGVSAGAPAVLNAPLARLPTAPLVEHALLALQSLTRLVPMDAVALLTSPYVAGWRAEHAPRARLAALLQAERSEALTLADLHALAERGQCPALLALLNRLKPLAAPTQGRHAMTRWAGIVAHWLAAWGWPGQDGLTPQEQAAHEAWLRALDTVEALDLVLPRQSFPEMLGRLRQIAGGITASECLAPDAIEILGIEEAAVLRPAAVWVLGLHDAAWPAVPASNPLLPPALLKRAGVPGSDAAADARRAQRLLETVARGAREAVLSYAQHDADTPRRPSGALAWPPTAPATAPSLFARWRPPDAPEVLEPAPEDAPVPLSIAAAAQRGGTGILAAQALCAFRAFALYRLLAEEVEDAEPGIAPRLRGEIAHAAMAALWRELGTQAAARALSPAAREAAIARAVASAIEEVFAARPQFDARQRGLEARRLQRLVAQSLEQDLQRPPFEVVAIEAQHRLELGALPLALRIDRVDRLADGAELILDYKTGRAQKKEWALPRPLAPQLLAYALARNEAPLGGVGFAQLRPGDCQLVTEPKSPPGDAAALAELRERWRVELTRLAAAFVAGEVKLDPRDGIETCERCGLQMLCRVHERPPPAADEDARDEP
ncbi:MAG TPA: PD-(D/E)XK nuclease family protein [Gammaproteobacteria bacterium]|nr:PD-(D/E)XK nuclease family protein [Gammaproteobacteria bacterium]